MISPYTVAKRLYPCRCGRIIYDGVYGGRDIKLNGGGAWRGFPHMCNLDGEVARGDTDESPSRKEELGL